MMQSLNPRNDWVNDKYDQLDNENDDEFWDPKKNVQHLHQQGSEEYGHVTSKIDGVVGLHQVHRNKGGSRHKISNKKYKDDSEDSVDEDPKDKHDKPKRRALKKQQEKKKLKKNKFDSDDEEEPLKVKEIKDKKDDKDLGSLSDQSDKEATKPLKEEDDELDNSDLEDSDEDLAHTKKGGKNRPKKSKGRARKDADRKGNLKHNIKAENLHKVKC